MCGLSDSHAATATGSENQNQENTKSISSHPNWELLKRLMQALSNWAAAVSAVTVACFASFSSD